MQQQEEDAINTNRKGVPWVDLAVGFSKLYMAAYATTYQHPTVTEIWVFGGLAHGYHRWRGYLRCHIWGFVVNGLWLTVLLSIFVTLFQKCFHFPWMSGSQQQVDPTSGHIHSNLIVIYHKEDCYVGSHTTALHNHLKVEVQAKPN